jgi:uncharacterized protein
MPHSNNLIHETSPYLLQHAHNPVNWYPWGETALQKAKEENKPILVSIGYAACHWCHVMERESFEDEATAAIMNENFVNIKIDREERPDLDHIYMDAVQAMTGSGGWPLNVFLTPSAKPFYGGTYFPPRPAFNRPSWTDILEGVAKAFRERRHEIDAQAENLTDHLIQANAFGQQQLPDEGLFSKENNEKIADAILKNADREWGGFGKAPKFPQTFSIQYLLRQAWFQDKVEGKDEGLKQALLSIDKMIEGGIYDQVGGGFARYSTDTEWLVPHFEKMLYDNALLLGVLADAYSFTRHERYREVIDETLDFIQREMMTTDHGFYAALDADSEGVEGKFYTWEYEEVKSILGKDADLFSDYYDITSTGNWRGEKGNESINIPRVKKSLENFAEEKNIGVEVLRDILVSGRKKLLAARNKRVRPLLDDKNILGWNALMNTACSKAFAATGNTAYRELAVSNMRFLLLRFTNEQGGMHHTWKAGIAKYPAFLDDYSFLIEALLSLQEVTGDTQWLDQARSYAEYVIENFTEEGTPFFFYTPARQEDVIIRKKEVYDGAVPSGNSVMAWNLYRLGILFDLPVWKERSRNMVSSLGNAILKYPTSFGNWACLFQEFGQGTLEIAITGDSIADTHLQVLKEFIPNRVLMSSSMPVSRYPLLAGKGVSPRVSIYLCSSYTCRAPVFSAKELITLINRENKG